MSFILFPTYFPRVGFFSGCLMSSGSIHKLYCGIYSTFKCSFDEFVGEKVFSPSYSSAILAPLLWSLERARGIALQAMQEKKALISRCRGSLVVFLELGLLFFWSPKSLQMMTAAMKLKTLSPWKKSYDQPRQHTKKQRRYFANKGPSSQGYGFPVDRKSVV